MWRQHLTEPLLSPQGTIKVCTSYHCTSQVHHWLFFFTSSWVTAKSHAVRGLIILQEETRELLIAVGTGLCRSAVGYPTPLDARQGISRMAFPFIHPSTPSPHSSIYHLLCSGTELSPEVQKRNHNSLNPHYFGIVMERLKI